MPTAAAAAALIAADPAARASHGVDVVGAELLADRRWSEFVRLLASPRLPSSLQTAQTP